MTQRNFIWKDFTDLRVDQYGAELFLGEQRVGYIIHKLLDEKFCEVLLPGVYLQTYIIGEKEAKAKVEQTVEEWLQKAGL